MLVKYNLYIALQEIKNVGECIINIKFVLATTIHD